jgi:hypothetical protein
MYINKYVVYLDSNIISLVVSFAQFFTRSSAAVPLGPVNTHHYHPAGGKEGGTGIHQDAEDL